MPEAYRQKFRGHQKNTAQTYVEFAWEKGNLFDRWCAACDISDFAALRDFIILEEFKKSLPKRMLIHFNDQKVTSLSTAAVMAVEYVLIHKVVFPTGAPLAWSHIAPAPLSNAGQEAAARKEDRVCLYCQKPGHIIANCLVLKRKEQNLPPATAGAAQPKGAGLIKTKSDQISSADCIDLTDKCFKPFMSDGWVSLTWKSRDERKIRILQDTVCSQSVNLADVVPSPGGSSCECLAKLQGVGKCVPCPLHFLHLRSEIVSGVFPVAVCEALPVHVVSMPLCGPELETRRPVS